MMTTLALLTALHAAPAQPGAFALKNPRASYGLFGQTRKDSKLLPGDLLIVAYDLQNLKVKEDGSAQYSLGIEVNSKAGKSIYKLEPTRYQAELSLGGTSRPAISFYETPGDLAPGEYVFTVTATDLNAGASTRLDYPFEVTPPKFGLIQTALTMQNSLVPVPPTLPVGNAIQVNTVAVGFVLGPKTETDPKKQQPHIVLEMNVYDETGKPTLPKPKVGGVTEVREEQFKKAIPFYFGLELNRPGKFKIVIKATDHHADKVVAEQTLEVVVYEQK